MNNASDSAKRLRSVLRKVNVPADDDGSPQPTDPLEQLLFAFLLWETTLRQADQAYNRLKRRIVDYNDLRVSDPTEIAQAIGERYSRIDERALRLRSVLREIYLREHGMSLESLKEMSKRDARTYLDSLTGMVPFVSASVVLLSLGGHAVPVDEQLVNRLKRDKVIEADAEFDEVRSFLEREIRSAEALDVAMQLRAYVDSPPSSRSRRTSKRTSKRTTRSTSRSTKKTGKTTKKRSKNSSRRST